MSRISALPVVGVQYEGSIKELHGQKGWATPSTKYGGRLKVILDCGETLENVHINSVTFPGTPFEAMESHNALSHYTDTYIWVTCVHCDGVAKAFMIARGPNCQKCGDTGMNRIPNPYRLA